MKRFATLIVGVVLAVSAFAEASFDQIQGLIQQQQYSAAAQGLEVIIKNHPNSAKAFYAMAQAQAGLGNLEKAKKALDIATGLNPTLDFAPASSVASLREAITPQAKKIEYIDNSHTFRNIVVALLLIGGVGGAIYWMLKKKRDEEAKADLAESQRRAEEAAREAQRKREQEAKEEAAREALRKHPNYGNPQFDPTNPDVLKPRETAAQQKKRIKEEQEALALREARARAEAAEEDARMARIRATTPAPAPTTTVVNNGSSTGDFAMGMVLGNMMGSSHHHSHDTERTVIRETVREVPAPSRDSSWDNDSSAGSRNASSNRSSSWDDDSSSRSSSSSSWDDDSSRRSSSWSSSSSDSGSSWSSSSDSSSSSSSSWD